MRLRIWLLRMRSRILLNRSEHVPILQGAMLLLVPLVALAACGEDEAPKGSATLAAPRAAAADDWLERGNPTPPEVWLVRSAAGPSNPELRERMRHLLTEADALFDETPRMLANRTAQLKRMLAERAVDEAPDVILEGFIRIARAGPHPGYSDLCQHYFNLRAAGLDRAAALEVLASAADRRSP